MFGGTIATKQKYCSEGSNQQQFVKLFENCNRPKGFSVSWELDSNPDFFNPERDFAVYL